MKPTLLVIYFCIPMICFCQEQEYNWLINTHFGIEKHDKRLFKYSEKELLLELQPKDWGTYIFDVDLNRKVWQHQKFSGFIGLGIGYENATFLRPFDHSYFNKDSIRILRNQNRYIKVQIPVSLFFVYRIRNNWSISGSLISNFLVFRSINQTENNSDVFPYTKGAFELDEKNFKLGVCYKINNFWIGVNSRIINFQKIDKIIFNSLINDPRVDENWEWYNPLRIDFTLGYSW